MNNNSLSSVPARPAATILIKSIDFIPMASHGQQYRRPFITNLTEETRNNLRVASARMDFQLQRSPEEIPAGLVSPYLHNFALPKTEGVPVNLPTADGNSWGDAVASFIIETEIQLPGSIGSQKCYIAGFTDRPVPTNGDPIDPNTQLTINAMFDYRKMQYMTASGITEREKLVNALQVLTNPNYAGLDNRVLLRRQRPAEIVTTGARLVDPSLQSPNFTVVDTRDVQNNTPSFSAYANNDPTLWTQALLKANVEAMHVQRMTGDLQQRHRGMDYRMAVAQHARDPESRQSVFVRALANVQNGVSSAQFTLTDLSRLDEAALSKIHVLASSKPDEGMVYSSFEGLDSDTQAANYIANSVPAIMAKHGIRSVDFNARNFFNPAELSVIGSAGVNDFIEPTAMDEFLKEVRLRVFDVISTRNKRSYSFAGRFDLFGSSRFSLEFEKDGARNYVSPTFANSVFSPLLTEDSDLMESNALAFDQVFQSMADTPAAVELPEESDLGQPDRPLNGEQPTITRDDWR